MVNGNLNKRELRFFRAREKGASRRAALPAFFEYLYAIYRIRSHPEPSAAEFFLRKIGEMIYLPPSLWCVMP